MSDAATSESEAIKRADEWARTELDVLLFDFEQRQKEIVVRSRWENYNFVLVATSLAAIGGLYLAFSPSIQATSWPDALSTIGAIGALVLSVLPINLAHIASSTELRRHYIHSRLEPRIRGLLHPHRLDTSEPLMTFESFDRDEHRWWYDIMLATRSTFTLLPSLILAIITIVQLVESQRTNPQWGMVQTVEVTCVILAGVVSSIAFAVLVIMHTRTIRVRRRYAPDELDPSWANPRALPMRKQDVFARAKDATVTANQQAE